MVGKVVAGVAFVAIVAAIAVFAIGLPSPEPDHEVVFAPSFSPESAPEEPPVIEEIYRELAITPIPQLAATDECALGRPPGMTDRGLGISFPKTRNSLSADGVMNLMVIFVDFEDISGSAREVIEVMEDLETFVDFIEMSSFGKVTVDLDYHPVRILVPVHSGSFGMQNWNTGSGHEYAKAAIRAADPSVDFSGVSAVVVVPPKGIQEIVYGPVSISAPGEGIPTREGPIQVVATGGADMFRDNSEWIWLAHEIGHGLGLSHIYAGPSTGTIFDVMYWGEVSPDFLAWNKWRLGWLGPQQVRCVLLPEDAPQRTTHRLTPLSTADLAPKATVVKISDTQAVVAELRAYTPVDRFRGWKEGLFVYLVDTVCDTTGDGICSAGQAVTPLYQEKVFRDRWQATLGAGESLVTDNVAITVAGCDSERCDFEVVVLP